MIGLASSGLHPTGIPARKALLEQGGLTVGDLDGLGSDWDWKRRRSAFTSGCTVGEEMLRPTRYTSGGAGADGAAGVLGWRTSRAGLTNPPDAAEGVSARRLVMAGIIAFGLIQEVNVDAGEMRECSTWA